MNKRRRNRLKDDLSGGGPTKAGWRIAEWCEDVGVSRSYTYELLSAKKINSVKAGAARIITTAPSDYLARLASEAAA